MDKSNTTPPITNTTPPKTKKTRFGRISAKTKTLLQEQSIDFEKMELRKKSAKKTPAEKTPAKKTPAKKTTAKKPPSEKPPLERTISKKKIDRKDISIPRPNRPILFNGELFDLTITTNNNPYGKSKIEFARSNGISFPLEYYKYELYKMTDDISDHKFLKRMERLAFLDTLIEVDNHMNISIQDFFKIYVNYLNGGDGINDHPSKLITVVVLPTPPF